MANEISSKCFQKKLQKKKGEFSKPLSCIYNNKTTKTYVYKITSPWVNINYFPLKAIFQEQPPKVFY